mmetsp:Transcript_6975/g.18734  ORF Transcript_6975/g.18734 Transcript_6975/m.18734 type:complete len:154 (+) Transcript_6975:1850-2311(+)
MLASSFSGSSLVAKRSSVAPTPSRVAPSVQAKAVSRKEQTKDRHRRLRLKLSGTPERPRLAVYRSNQHIYAQVIDDTKGLTLVSASTVQPSLKESIEEGKTATKDAAEAVGKKIAELCSSKNITKVAFDRGGFLYHGRIEAVADAARAGGLQF